MVAHAEVQAEGQAGGAQQHKQDLYGEGAVEEEGVECEGVGHQGDVGH